jgi:CDP-diacylglycerol--glycerol-3-phosphate 3-phosphatidyltransferase
MFDGRWRAGVDRGTKPFASWIRRTGLTADQLTALGLVLAVMAAVLLAMGYVGWGVLTGVASAFTDLLDGPLAKARGMSSPRGAFFDSVADRTVDALLFGATAWYLYTIGRPRWAALAVGILAVSALVSYERAKAESLGFVARGGIMERAERLIALGIGMLVFPLLLPILWAVLVLTSLTAVVRFARVWRQATEATRPTGLETAEGTPAAVGPQWRPGRVQSRWRSWRERAVLLPGGSRRAGAPVSRWRARRQAVIASRASRASRRAAARRAGQSERSRAGSTRGDSRRRMTEALRRRVDGGS